MIRPLLTGLLLAIPAISCSFAPPAVDRAYQESSVVVTVTVMEILEANPGIGNKAKARVDESWKGPVPGTFIEVSDGRYCTTVGLKKGGRYLLYSGRQTWTPGESISTPGTRSMPIRAASPDLQYFARLSEAANLPRYLQGPYLFFTTLWR